MRLYIDPGTGSMLFTILIGVLGAAFYSLRMLFIKLRYKIGKKSNDNNNYDNKIVIFSDDKRYWTTFEPICRELDKLGVEAVYYTESDDDPALECEFQNIKTEFIGKGNRAFAKLNMINATVLLSTTPCLDVYQWKRSKGVKHYVHIPHAPNDITIYRMFGIDYYDSILLSGEYQIEQIRELERIRNLPQKRVEIVGVPYLDELAKRLEEIGPAPDHPRTVLLAPSWGPSAIFSVYGSKFIDELLKTGYHIIIRPHPQSFQSEKELIDKLMMEFPESDQLEWNSDQSNFDVLHRSDILISDFSGVLFDFSLVFDKPVIYTDPNFDLGPYDAWWIKEPLWTTTILPQIGIELTSDSMGHLKELIDTCIDSTEFAEGRAKAKEETWKHFGEGAERTAKYLVKIYDELTSAEKED